MRAQEAAHGVVLTVLDVEDGERRDENYGNCIIHNKRYQLSLAEMAKRDLATKLDADFQLQLAERCDLRTTRSILQLYRSTSGAASRLSLCIISR